MWVSSLLRAPRLRPGRTACAVAFAIAACVAGASGAANSLPVLAISPSGSDAAPCTTVRPCRSFNRAYALARPGQQVAVRAGTYPAQVVGGTKSQRVTFVLAPAAHVLDMTIHADNLEVRGGIVDDIGVEGDSSGFVSRDSNRRVFSVWGASNVSFIGGDMGPSYTPGGDSPHAWISFSKDDKEPTNILIDHVYFHDVLRGSDSDHNECIFVVGGNGLTIRDSRFKRCDVFAIYFGTPWFGDNLPPVRNVDIENNFFDESTLDGQYDRAYYSVHFASDWSRLDHIRIAYNSAKQAMSFAENETPRSNFTVVGNVMPSAGACFDGITYRYNVFAGEKCSTTDRSIRSLSAAGFVDPGALDLRVRATSPAINAGDPKDYPRADIFGHRRPRGGLPDAGAVETR